MIDPVSYPDDTIAGLLAGSLGTEEVLRHFGRLCDRAGADRALARTERSWTG